MNAITSTIDLNLEALDVLEAPEMDGGDVLLYSLLAFGAGVGLGILIAT
jgi:hypothetical protein